MQGYQYSTAIPRRGGSRSGALSMALVACLLTILAFHATWTEFSRWWRLGARGVTTEAQAVAPAPPAGFVSWAGLTGQTAFDAVYIDSKGEAATIRVTVARGGPEFRRGRFVEVIYDPVHPYTDARLVSEQSAGLPEAFWLAGACGVVCLLMLLLALLRFVRLVREG